MDLSPFNDRVLVKRKTAETVTKSGIFIPDVAVQKSDQGIVLAVGNGKKNKDGKRIPMSVSVDDTVLYHKGSGTVVHHNGQELLVLNEEDILGIVTPN